MSATDRLFAGSIPDIYDRLFVPLIFEPYARDLAARVLRAEPKRVLEIAAGTGVVTRLLHAALPADAHLVATDLNPAMLTHASSLLPASPRLEWRQADALALPFDDASFDVVLCQFGVMFFPDKVQGYAEARRVLRPGGRFLFNVWDRIEENEFSDTVTEALATLYPADPPRFMARVPHGYADVERIRGELERAGFSAISSEARAETSRAASAHDAARAHCEGSPLRNELEARPSSTLAQATEHAAKALAQRFGTRPITGRIRAFVFEATA